MNRLLATAGGCVCLVLLSGCPAPEVRETPPTSPPGAFARDVERAQGYAPTISCDLLVRVKPSDSDSRIFKMTLWCPADGRIRLRASKLDFDFIDALVQNDGSFVLELVRTQEVVRGNLADITVLNGKGEENGPPFLTYLRVLVAQAKHGPLPHVSSYRDLPNAAGSPAGCRTLGLCDPTTSLQTTVAVQPDGNVASTSFLDAAGHETLRIDYNRYEHFHDLLRPTRMHMIVNGDSTNYSVVMSQIDAVPAINEERMHFVPSPGDHEIPLETFLARLRE